MVRCRPGLCSEDEKETEQTHRGDGEDAEQEEAWHSPLKHKCRFKKETDQTSPTFLDPSAARAQTWRRDGAGGPQIHQEKCEITKFKLREGGFCTRTPFPLLSWPSEILKNQELLRQMHWSATTEEFLHLLFDLWSPVTTGNKYCNCPKAFFRNWLMFFVHRPRWSIFYLAKFKVWWTCAGAHGGLHTSPSVKLQRKELGNRRKTLEPRFERTFLDLFPSSASRRQNNQLMIWQTCCCCTTTGPNWLESKLSRCKCHMLEFPI